MKNIITCLCLLTLTSSSVLAQSEEDSVRGGRIITSSYMIGAGVSKILDTYLSQEHFSGPGLTYLATIQKRKPGRKWSTLMEHQANISYVDDRSDDTEELQGDYTFLWGRLRQWKLLGNRLELEAGGMAVGNIGFIYNTANGNNPAQARLSLNIMPTGTATYKFRLWGRRMALRYEMQLPLVGLMFSPNYGQSYYEIFSQGNYDHNCVPTTFVSAPTMRYQFTADINISRKLTLRMGYLGDLQQADVNDLKSHVYSHRFMIGFVREFRLTNYRP